MPSLYDNAVASIRMGVEDYRQQDTQRDVSAVRNFYAGVLLLAKELLIRSAPKASPDLVIAAKIKLSLNASGDVIAVADGKNSIDYGAIHAPLKEFGLLIDRQALDGLQSIRNDLEHKASAHSPAVIRSAISSTFAVVTSLFRQLEEDPATALGEEWQVMLSEKTVYDGELKAARDTLSKVRWFSNSIEGSKFRCLECDSRLIAQMDADNDDQAAVAFKCRSCSAEPDGADLIEDAIEQMFGGDAYLRAKETGEEGPIYQCPACERQTLLETDEACANCNEPIDYESTCQLCGEHIPLSDYLDGIDGGLCSYHSWQADKAMHDD
ncbi:hypothetical protein C8J25_1092 [Sphingomonas faeni]|uniref:Uncharacterized protein n=1 Tax=Sphingomonas faeni TaxID=185950 RepID=A0A2T5TZ89_9SPHN|nr:hypothetical protein [Sphingomonas faeni]PTW44575.1 hypothetical protein C8J25_1092 [Sphingomonas faeni]